MTRPFTSKHNTLTTSAKQLCLFVALYLMSLHAGAQAYTTAKTLNGRAAKLYEQAQMHVGRNELPVALQKINQLLESEPNLIDARLMKAGLYHDLGQLPEAEAEYESALVLAPDYDLLVPYQLALTEMRLEKFDEAATHFSAFLASGGGKEATRQRAARYLSEVHFAAEAMRHPLPFAPYSLGDSINTPGREYLPVLTADGQQMIFTTLYDRQEDFYFSTRRPDGQWQKSQPLSSLNTPNNEGAQTISADGKRLIFTGCRWEGGLGSCDLYESVQKNKRWTQATSLGPVVNSPAWEAQPSLSANGQELYFTSDRGGGLGGLDLWVSRKGTNGQWGKPQNLGDSLNTKLDEESPFIHPDGQTLYFMSKGHLGMGKSDLFISRRHPNGQWGKPQNLGYPINTTGHEGALFVDLAGTTAYFTTNRLNQQADKNGNELDLDIYAFEMPESIRPRPCTYLAGRVVNEPGYPLRGARVSIFSDGSQQPVSSVSTDEDGQFLLVLPVGQDYAFQATAEGYAFYSDRFELAEVKSLTEPYRLKISLRALVAAAERQEPIVLKNVLFASASVQLLASSEAELTRLYDLLVANQQLRICINGHTDDVGQEADNQKLSEGRAKSVYDWLVSKGLPAERLSFVGFGESKPLVPNDSPENRAINRRTEFELIR